MREQPGQRPRDMRKLGRFRGSHPGDRFMKAFGRENPELGLRVEKE